MTYTHLTTDELVMIESYYHQHIPVSTIASRLKRSRTPIYNVINFLKEGIPPLSITNNIRKTNNGVVDVSVSFLQTNKSTLKKKSHRAGHPMSLSGVKKNPLTVPCGRFIGVSRKSCSMKKPYP